MINSQFMLFVIIKQVSISYHNEYEHQVLNSNPNGNNLSVKDTDVTPTY